VVDAAYLVGAQVAFFDSTVPESLEGEVERSKCPINAEKVVFLESLSTVTGETPNYVDYSLVIQRFGFSTIVDDSLGLGILGLTGCGWGKSLSPAPLAVLGALSPSTGCPAGFIAADESLIALLVSRSKTFSLEPPLPAFIASWACEGIDELELAQSARETLSFATKRLRSGLRQLGLAGVSQEGSPLVCLRTSRHSAARRVVNSLRQRGILIDAILEPRTLSEKGILRIALTSQHTEDDIQALLRALGELRLQDAGF
jgi:7-keto-8-aminopelargonate synthetase-like enzyme